MEIVHYKSIKEIPQNEWEKYGLDFALSDGVYDYAIYNESKRQTMRQSLKSTPPIIGDVASCIRPEDYLTMA